MATYKKRGFKNKLSSNKAEALENKSTTANVFNKLDEARRSRSVICASPDAIKSLFRLN